MNRFFVYARKSTEDDNRQVLSILSQSEAMDALAKHHKCNVLEVLSESRSAKQPGRPIFNDMMRRLKNGEADGILCWKLDRLARNPIDAGLIIWAVTQLGITIITPTQVYKKGDESVLLMWVEMGMAHKFIIDLKRNVTRGMNDKVKLMGWKPGPAPIGYLNERRDGMGILVEDPQRFKLVRRMWDLLLTGQYSVERIHHIATHEWGFRLRKSPKRTERPMAKSATYNIFSNPFFYGQFEYPRGSGCWYPGKHKAMISEQDFQRAQFLLGRVDRSRPKRHSFAFVGLMRCGECGAAITAEEKWKHQKNGNHHHYVYYHCTKKRNPNCSQGSIEERELLKQINSSLIELQISRNYLEWALAHIDHLRASESGIDHMKKDALVKRHNDIDTSIRELTKMRYNLLIEDAEFERERSGLKLEQTKISEALRKVDALVDNWQEATARVYTMLESVRDRFAKADGEAQKAILAELGSNLLIKNRKLIFEAKKPFVLVKTAITQVMTRLDGLEPPKYGLTTTQTPYFKDVVPLLCAGVEDVRTYFIKENRKKDLLDRNPGPRVRPHKYSYRSKRRGKDKAA